MPYDFQVFTITTSCKSDVKIMNGMDRFYALLFNVLNSSLLKWNNIIVAQSFETVCKCSDHNKCILIKNKNYVKYASAKSVIKKSISLLRLRQLTKQIQGLVDSCPKILFINNLFFEISGNNVAWVQHNHRNAYTLKLFGNNFLNFVAVTLKNISLTAKPWKKAKYIINFTTYDSILFSDVKTHSPNYFQIPLGIYPYDSSVNKSMSASKNKKDFMWLGMMTPAKNIEYLRDFAKKLYSVYGKSVDVYGHGPKLDVLKNQPGINLMGSISNDKVPEIMSKYSSLLLFSNYEGFPYVIIEAMHMGLTVIARNTFPSVQFTLSNNRGIIIPWEMEASESVDFVWMSLDDKNKTKPQPSLIKLWALNNLSYNSFRLRWIDALREMLAELSMS